MKRARRVAHAVKAATLALLGACAAAGGCHSVAGVEDVEFIETDANTEGCAEYCDLVIEACPGDKSVYEDRDTCVATCATFDASNPSEDADTFACRLEQAGIAANADAGEKSAHCVAAGPGGGSICASDHEIADCEGYCSLYTQACESISKNWGFENEDDCIPKCVALRSADAYTTATAADTGDTLACRLFYASRATLDPSEFNCLSASLYPHAGKGCEPIGEPDCEHYCSVVDLACTGDFQVYETKEQCRQVCANTDPGLVSDAGGQDTVGCRTYHAYNALALSELPHCSHSGPAGNGVCSVSDNTPDANCRPYCRLARAGCQVDFETLYDDENQCLEDCSTLEGALPNKAINGYSIDAAQRGDTVQCRILHAARALEDPDNQADYCRAVFGGAPCVEED